MECSSINPETTLGEALSPAAEHSLSGMRAWFIMFVVWMSGLAILALLMFERYEQGHAAALGVWLLALMCFYLSLCNTLLPLPTAWIVLFVASPQAGLFETGWLSVVTVAGLATLASVVANLNEYHGLAFLFRYGLGRRVRRTNVYQWAIRWFDLAPFQTLTLIGFVPIPIDAIRWLAILRHYSRVRFALAYFIGRGLRYLLFAWFAVLMQLGAWQILLIQAAIVIAVLAARLFWPLIAGLWKGMEKRWQKGDVASAPRGGR